MSTATPFSQTVDAITTGDEPHLRALLQAHPGLIHERAPFAHKATLLHYVAANGVEVQRSPKNAPAIARILLEAGAEADAVAPIYGISDTTLCLTVTSVHPYLAGVQANLVDVLADHGAKIDGVSEDGAARVCAAVRVQGSGRTFGSARRARRQPDLRRGIGPHGRSPSHAGHRYGHGQDRAPDGRSGRTLLVSGGSRRRRAPSCPDRSGHARPLDHRARIAGRRRGRQCHALLPSERTALCCVFGAHRRGRGTPGPWRGH